MEGGDSTLGMLFVYSLLGLLMWVWHNAERPPRL